MVHKGLTTEQVEESRKKHGSNILTPPEKESLWKQYLVIRIITRFAMFRNEHIDICNTMQRSYSMFYMMNLNFLFYMHLHFWW